MRITRSTLRRIIAEESARILAETKKKDSHERIPGGHQMRMAAGFEDEPEEEDWEDADKTDEEWAEEQLQGVMDMYGHPDPYGDAEAEEMGYEYDGAGGWKKPGLKEGEGKKRHQSPRDRLAAYLERVGADVDAVMAAVDDAVSRGNEEGSEVSSEDITFNLSDEVLDAIPEDDSDRWHSMLDAVLSDEVDLDAFADAEADRRDVEDTQRDLSHPSRFLEEGDDIDGDEAFGDVDPYEMGEYQHAYSMGGGSDEEGFAIDYDTGRPSPFAAKHLARPAPAVDDIEGSEDMGEVDPYEMGEYQHAHSMGGGADEEGFYMDYDRGSRKKGLSEARWAKLAGILEG